ncbi:amino acid/polyamine/organocation transporter (APC superfamily) [Micromonospora kangleipakensis]|uniref:Amino acid/polyamine/organocation transporter (APC superfamily) n=1 Tax=Micromonospora kangleipakensis TaxID=1077942 RepID=A0A4Q8B829_9ACTN|nr:APC family permease [Micromonospora kangleipakensis]RZU73093.1 amino acid/polyamine/organocation transporter (APC superfamily) [Micromonospora kangleipakensis]
MGAREVRRGDDEADRGTLVTPSAEFPPLGPEERAALSRIGERWRAPRGPDELPVDPTLGRNRPGPTPSRFGRLTPIDMFTVEEPDELVAAEPANLPGSRAGRMLTRLRRVLVGPPLSSSAVLYERMRKVVALPILSSDLLSSIAYGPEAMLAVLVLAGSAALGLSLPLAALLVVLMIAVGLSYRQTIPAYPHGAGSYIVASDNLGTTTGLAAAAGLMLDYVLTVSVSIAAGVHAVTSALPGLAPATVPLGVLAIAVLLAGNLRGVRTAGNIFVLPTYAFVVAVLALLVIGYLRAAGRGFTAVPPPTVPAVEGLGLLVVLRAFASGAVSMTGIEAVSNAIPAFRRTEWRNARTTLSWMVAMLVVLFVGLVGLIHLNGLAPRPGETILSQLGRVTFPVGPWYALLQAATALILLLSANTAFNDFPRLLFFMARNGHAPRRFLHLGDRLSFNNGLVALALAAAVIFAAFGGNTEALIPLFAVGVFLAFTLSQAGMVVHWRRHRDRGWRRRLAINAVGAALSGVVLLTAGIGKFAEGAWVVVIAVPLLVLLARRIQRHYATLHHALALHPPPSAGPAPPPSASGSAPGGAPPGPAGSAEGEELPQEVRHLVVVPVARLNRASLRALAYAASLGQPTLAVHIAPEEAESDRFREQWRAWGDHLRLETIVSPYRAVIGPLAHYLEALHATRPELTLTVIVPEVVLRRRWHRPLHSRAEKRLRGALRALPGVVVTSVPVHPPE